MKSTNAGARPRRPGYGIMGLREFHNYEGRLRLRPESLEYIQATRSADGPSRGSLRGGRGSRVSFPSRKMGFSVIAESRMEGVGFRVLEWADDVLEFYNQPPALSAVIEIAGERTRNTKLTPDALVLFRGTVELIEFKPASELERLVREKPKSFCRTEDGYRHPPAEAAAAKVGIAYRIVDTAQIAPEVIRNMAFLDDYYRCDSPAPDAVRQVAQAAIVKRPGLSIAALAKETGLRTEQIWILIADGSLFCNFRAGLVRDSANCKVFDGRDRRRMFADLCGPSIAPIKTKPHIREGAIIQWDGVVLTVERLGATEVWLRSPDRRTTIMIRDELEARVAAGEMLCTGPAPGPSVAALSHHTLAELSIGKDRDEILKGLAPEKEASSRTKRRWKQRGREAEASGVNRLVGMCPNISRRGNRTPRIDPEKMARITAIAQALDRNPRRRTTTAVYRLLLPELEREDLPTISLTTLSKILKSGSAYARKKAREGRGAAYANGEFCWFLGLDVPRHGEMPFQRVHIDHTQLDIMLRSAPGQKPERPWFSLAQDAFTRSALGLYLTFDPPSTASVMALLRRLFETHRRLPMELVLDHGKEFYGNSLSIFVNAFEISVQYRQGRKPRGGSVIERMFGVTDQQFTHNLIGNTQALRDPRRMTSDVDPRELAQLTLEDIDKGLSTYFAAYAKNFHRGIRQVPADLFERAMAECGERQNQRRIDPELFHLLTMPVVPKGTAKVQPGSGIKVNNLTYWNDVFRLPEVEGSRVEVRYDPDDIGRVFARVQDQWRECRCALSSELNGKTIRQLQIATAELRKSFTVANRPCPVSAKLLAAALTSTESAALQRQRVRDEARKAPVPAPPPSVPSPTVSDAGDAIEAAMLNFKPEFIPTF